MYAGRTQKIEQVDVFEPCEVVDDLHRRGARVSRQSILGVRSRAAKEFLDGLGEFERVQFDLFLLGKLPLGHAPRRIPDQACCTTQLWQTSHTRTRCTLFDSQGQSRCGLAAGNGADRAKEEDAPHGVLSRWDQFQGRRCEAARGVSRVHPG